jgi:glucokinase
MENPVVLALDFGGSKIAAAVAGPDGARIAGDEIAVRATDTAAATFARGVELARALAATITPRRPVAAVGAATFGIPFADRVELAPNVPGWEQLAFGAELAAAFPDAAVVTATDVKAAAQCELAGGALAGCDPGLYVNLGTGLAVAITVGGQVVNGRHGAAGEIGYSLRRPGAGASGPRLEDVVSGQALAGAARRLFGRADVAALLAAADGPAVAERDAFLDELCFHLVNLSLALDPARIVVGGGLVRSWPRIGPRMRAALDAALPYPPELTVAAHPYDAPLLGALALASSALASSALDHTIPAPAHQPALDVISEGAPT